MSSILNHTSEIPPMKRARTGSRLLALLAAAGLSAAPAAAIWPSFGGSVEADGVTATTVDANGNVYAIGNFSGTAYFGEEVIFARGLSDVFVVKHDPGGKVLWAASAGGLLLDSGNDLVVDAAQNVYVIGSFMKEMQFESDDDVFTGGGLPLELGRTGSDGRDWFIAKLDSLGAWQWARQVGHPTGGQQIGYAIALAPAVNDPFNPMPAGVIAGGLAACAQLAEEDDDLINTLCDNKPIKVYRLDSDGGWIWTLSGGNAGANPNPIWISDLASDANGQVYALGAYLGANSLETSPPTALTFTGVPAGGTLEFKHRFEFDEAAGSCYDGGVVEYSTNGGTNWYDILSGAGDNDPSTSASVPRFLTPATDYNGNTNGLESTPFVEPPTYPTGVRAAFCNSSGGAFWTTQVDLGGFAGQNIRFRWRLGTGFQVGAPGWNLDDFSITAGNGEVLLSDNVEAGGGNFSPTGTAGVAPWSIATNYAASATHSWYVPDAGVVSDQRLTMGQSVALPEGTPSMFVAKIGASGSTAPVWQWAAPLPAGTTAEGLATDGAGGVFLAGATRFASSSFGGNTITTVGAFAARLTDNGTSYAWQWARGATGGEGADVTVLFGGDLAVTGTYSGAPQFTDVQNNPGVPGEGTFTKTLTEADDGTEVFVARLAGSGATWRWVTFAGNLDPEDPLSPAQSPGSERGTAVSASADGLQIYVGGSFDGQATFGTIEVGSLGATDAFVANLTAADGAWYFVNFQKRVVGAEVVPPLPREELCLNNPTLSIPTIEIVGPGQAIPDYFHWTPPDVIDEYGHLYAVQPVNAIVKWKKDPACPFDSDLRAESPGASDWPKDGGALRYCGSAAASLHPGEPCVQLHIAGAPTDIEPAPSGLSFGLLAPPRAAGMSPDAAVVPGGVGQARFNALTPGFSVLIFADDPASRNIAQDPVVIRAVESVAYDTPLQIAISPDPEDDPVPVFTAADCTIGEEIDEPSHEEYGGKNGYVLNERAYFDGVGPDKAYDRQTRLGHILPVNRMPPASLGDDDMAVAWYKFDQDSIAWPQKSVRYDCRWPVNPDKIIIASELGSEVLGQPPLDPAIFPGARIYQQADDSLPGFNPNDEHALLLPANSSTGFSAVFALRSDHTAAEVARSSEPYVLMKYSDPGDGNWRFRIYQVLATGAGYETFQYGGTAGTPVNPPYPVRLLGNCAESEVTGKPAFKDYKNQTWAKAAGDLVAQYWYPLQPTFFYDRAGNHVPEKTTGQCVAWLGGLLDDPVDVYYSIAWPPEVPSLLVGETLMEPKFGLPDIANQAAVEIVFDEKVDRWLEAEDYSPKTSLARIIDPLSSRTVYLPGIPPEIGTETDPATGRVIPVSDASGTEQLPSTLVSRVSYDPLNKKLHFAGLFEQPPIGEPVLLINVLTLDERSRLKRLDGGTGTEEESFSGDCSALADGCTWDQAIEALYNISRNPLRLDLDLDVDRCHIESSEDPPGSGVMVQEVVCDQETDDEVDEDLLLGLQDEDGDGVPEPLQVVGFTPALTAGFAQGTGYLTLAFNNDPSLNPLPVSLNIIRVDCLRVPQPPDPDRISTYVGEIKIIEPGGVFDESLTLRHSGDFAGSVDGIEFEWFFHPDEEGTPPSPNPDPDNGQLNGWLQFTDVPNPVGAIDITIEGANIQTLSDNWYLVRYRYVDPPIDVGEDGLEGTPDDGPLCGGTWSIFAGQPSPPTDPKGQLAEGWIKRVVKGLGPFEQRVKDFHSGPTNTYASMLFQIGERYEGDIALNDSPDNLNAIGLISAYQTVLNRAKKLSIEGTPPIDYAPVNNAILLVASRLADFYTLLGNEAYGDAADPMIGFGTGSDVYGTLAPAVFTFQNQLDSQLEEELVLLRGRDDSLATVVGRPVYNRLIWNFTTGEGEFAYQVNYNITDQDLNGVVDEADAKVLFPQGHGDAWGHYLTAMTTYYELLRHPFFTWPTRSEAVTVGGVPVGVDFLDERKFAKIAAAKAKAGAEIVDLTYRARYVEAPAGQWQGYKDTDEGRAWGLSEWGRRAGQGAYLDWVVGNAILPEVDPDPEHVGIQRIDRQNVEELGEIMSQFASVQTQVDEADRGLNPLGLAKGVVPFDIDPSFLSIGSNVQGQTHFEQIYQRAQKAMSNAVATFNHANLLTELIRRTQDTTESIYSGNFDREIDFKNRLIEIFGYPYEADIGPTGAYEEGYDGPDVYHYMYVDGTALTGAAGQENQTFTATFDPMPNGIGHFDFDANDPECGAALDDDDCALDDPDPTTLDVTYHVTTSVRSSEAAGNPTVADSFFFVKPAEWGSSQRRAPGELQGKLSDLMTAMNAYEQILTEYNSVVDEIIAQADLIEATYDVRAEQITIRSGARAELMNLTISIETLKATQIVLRRVATSFKDFAQGSGECVPKTFIAGLAAGGDMLSPLRCGIVMNGGIIGLVSDLAADGLEIATNAMEAAKEDVEQQAEIEVTIQDASLELFEKQLELEKLFRQEALTKLEAYTRKEAVEAARGNYMAALATGQRTLAELEQWRANSGADIQTYRYRDMAFRIFRNDALQKYRAQFDLVARYAFLAATAYDYETNLLGGDNAAGRNFLTSIVKERALGQIIDGEPVPGSRGLAGPLGQMAANFGVLKGQLGFNNPQFEDNGFSIRREALRLEEVSDEEWRDKLENEFRVDDLWALPEFRRYCRPFAPESAGPQPGLVIPFETTVTFGLNYFGWPLGPGDSFYDASRFSTRIRSVGTWFDNYNGLPLANTPRIYLVPVGADVLTSPSDSFITREWQVVDQVIPVPLPLGAGDLDDPNWIPINDSLSDNFVKVRRFGTFRAFHSDGNEPPDPTEMTTDSTLIGRSVWNRRWLLIIPGGNLLANPDEGLDTFIHGPLIPGGGGERDGNGVKDIEVFFSTYAYTGN
jgi:hypothetical protein